MRLVDLNEDLKRLWNDGYEMETKGALLLIHNVPYLNREKYIKKGTIVTMLALNGNVTIKPVQDHVAYFIGEQPCDENGVPLTHIIGSNDQLLGEGVTINYTISSKPKQYDSDYYTKIKRYVALFSSPAQFHNPFVTAKTFKVISSTEEDASFNYLDTNSSEAKIEGLSTRFKGQRVAIIGLGGTGSYLLDLIAKVPLKEIHLFDGDKFLQKNAFRAPGAPSVDKLKEQLFKVEYFCQIYSKMHRNIVPHPEFITPENIGSLSGFDFVFLCLDSGSIKPSLIEYLFSRNINFIDVGMGINQSEQGLSGQLRVTTGTSLARSFITQCIPFTEEQENEYSKNIQIADLNCLNAALAVVKWKKLSGYYHDMGNEYNSIFRLRTNKIINDEIVG